MENKMKCVVVTGASKGIGFAAAKRLLADGYRVAATSKNGAELASRFADERNAVILPCDLSEPAGVAAYAKTVVDAAGPVSGLVCCAGAQLTAPLHMINEAKFRDIFNLNTFGAMLLVSALARKGACAADASFVLISSLAAHEGASGKSAYAASKAALEGFTRAAAPELAAKGIRINCVAPGIVKTPMTEAYFAQLTTEQREAVEGEYPLGLGEPSDVATMIRYLISAESRWVTGQIFIVDGGHSVRKC
jgi:NAD(P)-dependent dehydrogenase (short-subunit alcohol dehydrogenase family)